MVPPPCNNVFLANYVYPVLAREVTSAPKAQSVPVATETNTTKTVHTKEMQKNKKTSGRVDAAPLRQNKIIKLIQVH